METSCSFCALSVQSKTNRISAFKVMLLSAHSLLISLEEVNESNRKNSFPGGLYPKQRLSVRQSGLKVRSSTAASLTKQTKMPFFLRD